MNSAQTPNLLAAARPMPGAMPVAAVDPQITPANVVQAISLLTASDQLPQAQEMVRLAQALFPSDPAVLRTASLFHESTGQWAEALNSLVRLDQIPHDTRADTAWHLVRVLRTLGEVEMAAAKAAAAIEEGHGSPELEKEHHELQSLLAVPAAQ